MSDHIDQIADVIRAAMGDKEAESIRLRLSGAASVHVDQWPTPIPVAERLPPFGSGEDNHWVLGYYPEQPDGRFEGGQWYKVACYRFKRHGELDPGEWQIGWVEDTPEENSISAPTHWLPLPPAPSEPVTFLGDPIILSPADDGKPPETWR